MYISLNLPVNSEILFMHLSIFTVSFVSYIVCNSRFYLTHKVFVGLLYNWKILSNDFFVILFISVVLDCERITYKDLHQTSYNVSFCFYFYLFNIFCSI